MFSVESKELFGYFTLTLKPLSVRGETVSNTTKIKLLRISELDESSDTYTISAYLIARLGINYMNGANNKITGKDVIFLLGNRFSRFGARQTTSDMDESHELIQLLRLSGIV